MATQPTAPKQFFQTESNFLRSVTVKICLIRLVLLTLFFGLILGVWSNLISFGHYFLDYNRYVILTLVLGYGISLYYLLFWSRFESIRFLLLSQLFFDTCLSLLIIFITGGLKSDWYFLVVIIIFLYGRMLGIKWSFIVSIIYICFYSCLLWLQYKYFFWWNKQEFSFPALLFSYVLLCLAIALTNLLIFLHKSREKTLTDELISQEIALARARALQKEILEVVDVLLFVLKEDGTILFANDKAAQFLGRKRAVFVLNKKLSLFSPQLNKYFQTHKTTLHTFKCTFDQSVFLGNISFLSAHQSYVFYLKDITEEEQWQKKMFQMKKMASIGELATGIAHEIKNPLAGIKGALQLLHLEDDPVIKKRLFEIVFRDINRLDGLVKNFLTFAKPVQGQKEEVKVKSLLAEILLVGQTAFQEVEIKIDPSADNLRFYWNRDQLKQVLLNLLLNARDAALQGGKKIFIKGKIEADYQLLFIEDTGSGLDLSLKDKVFEPFFTTKAKGTGLGLAISLRLAGLNDSELYFDFEYKNGSRVVLKTKVNKIQD